MAKKVQRNHPQLILLWAARNYISESEFKTLLDNLYFKRKSDKIFIKKFVLHFDIERFKSKPIVWQDIWIYNYLTYDSNTIALTKSELIKQYEDIIVIPAEKSLIELKKLLV